MLRLGEGFDYSLRLADFNIAFRGVLAINASVLGAANHALIDGSSETDGFFAMSGGAGDDGLQIGSATVMSGSTFNGGAGDDMLVLKASNVAFTLNAHALTSVDTVALRGDFISVVSQNGNVGKGFTQTVDMSHAAFAVFDGSAETAGSFHFLSGAQTQTMRGGANGDSFDMTAAAGGGSLGAYGNGGNDHFLFSDNFGDSAAVNGGSGFDTVELNGDYVSIVLASYAMNGIEELKLDAGHSYGFTMHNSNVAAGQTLTVDASALDAGHTLTFNGAAESNGYFAITAGAGDDSVFLGAFFNTHDSFDGGAGNDTLELKGDYSSPLGIGDAMMADVETLKLDDGFSYNLAAFFGSDRTLTVDASSLTAGHTLTFMGNGHLVLIGGAGDDALTGSNDGTTFTGGMGADTIFADGDDDEDLFVYNSAAESSGAGGYDSFSVFQDAHFSLAGAHSVIFFGDRAGTVNAATFDADLRSIVDDDLGRQAAMRVHVIGGDLDGHDLLVVDANGSDTYEPGADYVFDVSMYLGTIDTTTFI